MSLLYTPTNPRSTRVHQRPVVGCRTRVSLQRSIAAVFATDFGNLNWRHLESGRRRLTRTMRRARVWIRARLTQPLTAKGKQSRMGKGKGKLRGWTGYVRPGTLLYELSPTARAAQAEHPSRHTRATGEFPYGDVARKLPFGVKVVRRAVSETRQHRQFLTFRAPRRRAALLPKRTAAFCSPKTIGKAKNCTLEAGSFGVLPQPLGAFPATVVYFLWGALQRWETHCGVAAPTPLRSFGAPLLTSATVTSVAAAANSVQFTKDTGTKGRTSGTLPLQGPREGESASSRQLTAKSTESPRVSATLNRPSGSKEFSYLEKRAVVFSTQQDGQGRTLHRLKRRLARKSRGLTRATAQRLLGTLALRRTFLRGRASPRQWREMLHRERAVLVRLLRRDGAVVRRAKRRQLRRTKQLAALWAKRTRSSEQPRPAFGKQFCIPTHIIPAAERALRSLRGVGPGLRLLCLEEARTMRRFRHTQQRIEQFRRRARRRSRGRRRSLHQQRWGSWRALQLRRSPTTGFRSRKQLPPRPPLTR
jgi:ribosomal protein L16/L10AE